MSVLLHSGSSLRYMQQTTQPMLSCAPETRLLHSRKTISDIDTVSLNCNQNKKPFFPAINPVYWLQVQSDAWKKNIVWKQKRMA